MDVPEGYRELAPDLSYSNSRRWKRRPKGQGAKGKQIHICSELHDGEICGKVYSRAEHLRRHHTRHHSASISRRESLSSTGSEREANGYGVAHSQNIDPALSDVQPPLRTSHEPQTPATEAQWSIRSGPQYEEKERRVRARPRHKEEGRHNAFAHLRDFGAPQYPVSNGLGLKNSDELKLMGYWIDQYKQSFNLQDTANAPSHQAFFTDYTPQLCAGDDHIKDIVLSIASSHLQMNSYAAMPLAQQRIGEKGYQKALVVHRNKVQELSSGRAGSWSDAELETAVFMSSLISIRTIMNAEQMEPQLTAEGIFDQLLLRQHLLKGYHRLYQFAYPRIKSRPMVTQMLEVHRGKAGLLPDLRTPDMAVQTRVTKCFFPYLLENITEEEMAKDLSVIYQSQLRLLDWVFETIIAGTDPEKIHARWRFANATTSAEFIELLQARRPRALAIYAHFISFEKLPGIPGIWWAPRSVKARINALRTLAPREWQWAFERPLDVANGEGLSSYGLPLPLGDQRG